MAVYESMKDSGIEWIGNIPSTWKAHTLYQLVTQVKNKNSNLSEQNLLSLSYGKIKRKDINSNGGLLPESFNGYNIIEDGDIVLRLTDLQNDHTSLRVGRATERGIITSAYTTLRPISKDSSKYLYYLLHAFDIKKGFYGMGSGVRQGLNYDEVKELRVIIPSSTAEQSAIATYLDDQCTKIDALIAEAKASIEEYKQWKASLIFEAVTKGLDSNAEMKDSGVEWIGKMPKEWGIARLKTLFSFSKGLSITKADLVECGIPVISYGQIHAKTNTGTHLSDDLLRYVPDKYIESSPDCLIKQGDIILADTSEDLTGLGNAVLMDRQEQVFAGYHTIIMHPDTPHNSKYLSYLIKTDCWRSQLRSNASGIKVFSVTQKMLKTCTVILPTPEDQETIVQYLDNKCSIIDAIISEKTSIITNLESYKRSLIFEAVTGKRKVV